MAQVNIDGKEFEFDSFSDEAKATLVSLQFVQNEVSRLQSQLAIYKTAGAAYTQTLKNQINTEDN